MFRSVFLNRYVSGIDYLISSYSAYIAVNVLLRQAWRIHKWVATYYGARIFITFLFQCPMERTNLLREFTGCAYLPLYRISYASLYTSILHI